MKQSLKINLLLRGKLFKLIWNSIKKVNKVAIKVKIMMSSLFSINYQYNKLQKVNPFQNQKLYISQQINLIVFH